jgi:hypothetical protein
VKIDWIYLDPAAFVTTWETVSPQEEVIIPITGLAYNVVIAWGDGTTGHYTGSTDITHIYADAGTYKVSIVGSLPSVYFYGNSLSASKLRSIDQW